MKLKEITICGWPERFFKIFFSNVISQPKKLQKQSLRETLMHEWFRKEYNFRSKNEEQEGPGGTAMDTEGGAGDAEVQYTVGHSCVQLGASSVKPEKTYWMYYILKPSTGRIKGWSIYLATHIHIGQVLPHGSQTLPHFQDVHVCSSNSGCKCQEKAHMGWAKELPVKQCESISVQTCSLQTCLERMMRPSRFAMVQRNVQYMYTCYLFYIHNI